MAASQKDSNEIMLTSLSSFEVLPKPAGTFSEARIIVAKEQTHIAPSWFHEGEYPPAVASGIVVAMLNMTFSLCLAAVVFAGKPEYTMLGFDANTFGCCLACLAIVFFSECPVYVGCPNSVAAVVFAPVVARLSECLSDKPEGIIPTVVIAVALTTFLVGILFVVLGTYKLTKLVQIFPQSVMSGFLAAIGASLFKYSLKVGTNAHLDKIWMLSPVLRTKDFWILYWPVPPLAIALFLIQRHGLLSPTMMWGTFLCVPPACFYAWVFVTSQSIDSLQENNLLLEKMETTQFYDLWNFGRQFNHVDWATVQSSVLSVVPLIPVVVVDVLVGFAATRKAGEFNPDFDNDALITGRLFWVQALACCPLATNSTKLSLLNVSIAGSKSRLPTAICGFFCGFLFFGPPIFAPLFPRFFLAYLLLFNSLGFLVKNLWDARHHMTTMEFVIPWVMVYADLQGGLDTAVVVGFVFATSVFALKYARLGVVKTVVCGPAARSLSARHVRTPLQETVLSHAAEKLVVVQLQHYLFFGSIMYIERMVNQVIALGKSQTKSHSKQAWIVMDWSLVDGLDASVPSIFAVAVRKLASAEYKVIFTGMQQHVFDTMQHEGALKKVYRTCEKLHEGMTLVEEDLLQQSVKNQQAWLRVAGNSARKEHKEALDCMRGNILQYMLGSDVPEICRGARSRKLIDKEILCTIGRKCSSFFIVQQGVVVKLDVDDRPVTILHAGACCNEWALLLGEQTQATFTIQAAGAATVLEISHGVLDDVSERAPQQVRKLEQMMLHQTLAMQSDDSSANHERRAKALTLDVATFQVNESPPLRVHRTSRMSQESSYGTSSTGFGHSRSFDVTFAKDGSTSLRGEFDRLSDGEKITAESLMKEDPSISAEEAAALIAEADLDGDGAVSWMEFANAVLFVYDK